MYIITPQTVASLQNLVNKHALEISPVFNGLMCMRVSVILNWPLVKVFSKAAPQPVVDASVVIVNERFPILIVLNDPRILFFHQIISCLSCESIQAFLSKLPLLIFSAFSGIVHVLWLESY